MTQHELVSPGHSGVSAIVQLQWCNGSKQHCPEWTIQFKTTRQKLWAFGSVY